MKIVNWLENILIAAAVGLVMIFAFNQLKFKPMQKQFEKQIKEQTELIKELSNKETYKIDNSFGKLKTKDGQINLQVNSKIEKDSLHNKENDKKNGLFSIFKRNNE